MSFFYRNFLHKGFKFIFSHFDVIKHNKFLELKTGTPL
nr:MAG TPA: hypothetical protein [Caudoviricetes sp.]